MGGSAAIIPGPNRRVINLGREEGLRVPYLGPQWPTPSFLPPSLFTSPFLVPPFKLSNTEMLGNNIAKTECNFFGSKMMVGSKICYFFFLFQIIVLVYLTNKMP
jgi:hypothetical protein